MSIKRIIELEEVTVNDEIMYKAVGCNTLFFDKNGFDKITKPVEKENKEYLNCKFWVIEGDKGFETGKIYECRNGKIESEKHETYPALGRFRDFDDLVECFANVKDRKNTFGSHYSITKTIKVMRVVD